MSEIKKQHQHEILNGYEFQSMSNQNESVNTACELLTTEITDSQSQLLRFKLLNSKNERDINVSVKYQILLLSLRLKPNQKLDRGKANV